MSAGMSKKTKSLSIALSPFGSRDSAPQSPSSPRSPRSPMRRADESLIGSSEVRAGPTLSVMPSRMTPVASLAQEMEDSPTLSSPPPIRLDTSVDSAEGKSFLSLSPVSKPAQRPAAMDSTIRQVPAAETKQSAANDEREAYNFRAGQNSTPNLVEAGGQSERGSSNSSSRSAPPSRAAAASAAASESSEPYAIPRRPVGAPPRSGKFLQPRSNVEGSAAPKKNRPKPFAHLLSRTRSTRVDAPPPSAPRTMNHNRFAESESLGTFETNEEATTPSLKTAPLQHERDRTFRDLMGSSTRHRSADRHGAESDAGSVNSQKEGVRHQASFASSFRDGSGGGLLSGLKSSSTKAADGIGKAGKGIFGKLARVGSSSDNVTDENYVCTTINLPLVEQTRRTRISKRLEHSKDKTEFWMPALPWRCIDYLNDRGCEEEGLYRIPGSGPRVKHWQRRFDTQYDINLFEEPDLYDINIIGSMFKAWLRELPDEILPKSTQARIAEQCMGATEVPQMLKDELSKLPPFNYYLLFAITCHLSLLHSYVDKNKMDYRNLCICFQPCLKIDGFCFQFLVCDWKHCWQGCWTEKEALLDEYRVMDGLPPSSAGGSTENSQEAAEERAMASTGSSKATSEPRRSPERGAAAAAVASDRPAMNGGPTTTDGGRSERMEEAAGDGQTEAEVDAKKDAKVEVDGARSTSQQLPPLAPLLPLSPLEI